MNFGERLKNLRKSRGLRQKELATIFNITESAVGMWERDERIPTADNHVILADTFNVSVDYLLGRAPEVSSGSTSFDSLLPQLLAHLTRVEQSIVEMRADIQDLKEIAQAGALLDERFEAAETDIKVNLEGYQHDTRVV